MTTVKNYDFKTMSRQEFEKLLEEKFLKEEAFTIQFLQSCFDLMERIKPDCPGKETFFKLLETVGNKQESKDQG